MNLQTEPPDLGPPFEKCTGCGKPTNTWADPHTPVCAECATIAESVLKRLREHPTFIVKKEPDDPIALRASIGGTLLAGYYCVYRGDRHQVMAAIRKVLDFMDKMPADANEADTSVLGS